MASRKPLVIVSGELQQLGSSDTLDANAITNVMFGLRAGSGISVGLFPFVALFPYAATIVGVWGRINTGSLTFLFRKKAYGGIGTSDPDTTDRINTSGFLLNTVGTTKFTDLSDFSTLDIAVDDIVMPELYAVTDVVTTFQCGLFVKRK